MAKFSSGIIPSLAQNQMDKYNLEKQRKEEAKTPEQKCKEQGGFWDAKTNSCSFTKPSTANAEEVVKSSVKQAGGYVENGSFVPSTAPRKIVEFNKDGTVKYTTPTGQVYNLSKEEYQNVLGKSGTMATQQTKEIGAFEGGALQEAQKQIDLSQLGLTEEQIAEIQANAVEAPIDYGQAVTAGLANVAPSLVGGATGGAVVGAIGGAGIGAVPAGILGGIGGAVTGFLNGVRNNIKSQQGGEIGTTTEMLSEAKEIMRKMPAAIKLQPNRSAELVDLYNQKLAQVYAAQAKLKRETQGNLNSFMDDGTEKLAEFDLFLQPGGYKDYIADQMKIFGSSNSPMTTEELLYLLQEESAE